MSTTELRSWDVFLIGGSSGAGKTSLSYDFARLFGVALTEIDDFQVILECMTTPEQLPALHFWQSHPAPETLSVAEIVASGVAIGEVMQPALVAVILNHIETHRPIVLEGDFILPAILAEPAIAQYVQEGRVRGVLIHEDDQQQFVANYLAREPQAGLQQTRAAVSWASGQLLKQAAEQYGMPVVSARPWATALARLCQLAQ